MMTTERFCNIFIGLWVALAVAFFIAVTFACFGCASAPVSNLGDITMALDDDPNENLRIMTSKGCTQSTIAKPGDAYSYQGPIDPRTIFETWAEDLKLRWGNFMQEERCYRNSDITSDLQSATIYRFTGRCRAFCILHKGEPRVFLYKPSPNCYIEEDLNERQRKDFKVLLLKILYANSTAI